MATPSKPKPSNQPDDEYQLPIQKTNPLIFVGVGAAVVLLAVVGFLLTRGKQESKAEGDIEAAVHSARITADEAKAKREAQLEHRELAAKAWAIASEQERAAAAASAAAAAHAEEKPPTVAAGEPKDPSGAAPPPKKKASSNDLDQLDKLGSAVNSELGGP